MLNLITIMLCGVIFARLFSYQRAGARYRPIVSAAATFVMACCGALVINISTGELQITTKLWPMVMLLAVFAISLVQCGGNLARVLIHDHWGGEERRKAGH